MKLNEGRLLLLFTGIMTGVFLSSFIVNTASKPTIILTYQQYQKYNQEANELKSELKGLYMDERDLRNKLNNYYTNTQKNKNVTETLKKELEEVKLFAGEKSINGPGVEIEIDDSHDYLNNEEIMNYITHNTDLLSIVNELRNAGAEGISINGKRFYERTAITCEGSVIMVNGEYIVPPFQISAVGDPEALIYALSIPESHVAQMKERGLYVKIIKRDNININQLNYRFLPKYIKQSK